MGGPYFAEPEWITNPAYLNRGIESSAQADLALRLIERWGAVAATRGPEDSAGRATTVLQTPEELVTRACEVAELTYGALEARGWLRPAPVTVEDMCAQAGYKKALVGNAEYEHDQHECHLHDQVAEFLDAFLEIGFLRGRGQPFRNGAVFRRGAGFFHPDGGITGDNA